MKKLIIKACFGCPFFTDFDDPPGYCSQLDKDVDIPDEDRQTGKDYILKECPLEDYPDYNIHFDKWLTDHFPHIKREWEILRVKDDR